MPKIVSKQLTVKKIESLKPGVHCDGDCLYLQVVNPTSKAWLFKFQWGGKTQSMGIGSLRHVSLAEARDKAHELRRLVRDGINPLAQRREQRAAQVAKIVSPTFEACAKQYAAKHGMTWSAKHQGNWMSSLTNHAYPTLGKVEVSLITTQHIVKVMAPIWNTQSGPKVLQRVRDVIQWATINGLRTGDEPALTMKALKNLLPARVVAGVEHRASLPWQEVHALVAALRARDGIVYRATEFMILTVGRTDEIRGAPWTEINRTSRLWTIPPERMKGRETHTVPLCGRAMEILDEMEAIRQNDYIFPGGIHQLMHTHAILRAVREARGGTHDKASDVTAHGFRSTIYEWVRDATDYPDELVDIALAHKVSDQVKKAYMRAKMIDKRRVFMEHWARVCNGEEQRGVVVPLRVGA